MRRRQGLKPYVVTDREVYDARAAPRNPPRSAASWRMRAKAWRTKPRWPCSSAMPTAPRPSCPKSPCFRPCWSHLQRRHCERLRLHRRHRRNDRRRPHSGASRDRAGRRDRPHAEVRGIAGGRLLEKAPDLRGLRRTLRSGSSIRSSGRTRSSRCSRTRLRPPTTWNMTYANPTSKYVYPPERLNAKVIDRFNDEPDVHLHRPRL